MDTSDPQRRDLNVNIFTWWNKNTRRWYADYEVYDEQGNKIQYETDIWAVPKGYRKKNKAIKKALKDVAWYSDFLVQKTVTANEAIHEAAKEAEYAALQNQVLDLTARLNKCCPPEGGDNENVPPTGDQVVHQRADGSDADPGSGDGLLLDGPVDRP